MVTVTWAKLLVGTRIAARAEKATLSALTISERASSAVIAPLAGARPAVGWYSTVPAPSVKTKACVVMPG